MDRLLLDYRPELELFEESATADRQAASQATEMQHAVEVLERIDDGELDDYLVELIDRAGGPGDRSVTGALAAILGRVARRLVPRTGAPPAAAAGQAFGLELEGLSLEDQAFEVARHFVRFASEAARRAGRELIVRNPGPGSNPPRGHSPQSRSLHMHDIDRTQLEYASEMPGFEAEQFEFEGEWGSASGGVLSEAEEYELATELLGVASEAELDQFLGDLIKKVAKGAGKLVRSPIGQAVGGVLKGVAKKALPLAGGALGAMVGGPLGAKIGSGLASAAGGAIGLEGEALAQEDQELEGAKQFVRIAADTVKKAASASPAADPRSVAQSAAVSAARQLAPGLLKQAGGGSNTGGAAGRGQNGRWVRRGHTIVLYGA
jgi:hypothetical protein